MLDKIRRQHRCVGTANTAWKGGNLLCVGKKPTAPLVGGGHSLGYDSDCLRLECRSVALADCASAHVRWALLLLLGSGQFARRAW